MFICVLRFHTSFPKGEGQNLLSSYSVVDEKIPAYWLANPNFRHLLILEHLLTPALHKRLALFYYGKSCYEGLLSQYSVHFSNGKLFGGRFGAHYYSASPDIRRITKKLQLFSLCSDDLLRTEKK